MFRPHSFMRHKKYPSQRTKHAYIPAPNSGGHALLVGMLRAEQNELIKNLTKQQVLDYCSKYSGSGIKDNAKIWASMKGLIDRALIGRHISRDPLYFLLDEGRDLAQKLITLAEGGTLSDSQDDSSRDTNAYFSQQSNATESSSQPPTQNPELMSAYDETNFELKAGTHEIVLIVDQREKMDTFSWDEIKRVEMRTLACGDFIWVARPLNTSANDRTKDLVLDCVIERKRLDDLSASIIDGRFEQQKQRLLDSGVRRPVYMIEEFGIVRPGGITSSGLSQAVVNILVHDRIEFERVKNIGHVKDYLIGMTQCLERLYLQKDLRSCSQTRLKSGEAEPTEFMTFSEFQIKGAKITNWTVREMFAKHLIQVTGMSDKRVAVVIKSYPTISALVNAYRQCDSESEKENMLSKLKIPDSNRTIGPALSKRIYACYAMPPAYDAPA